MLDEHVSNDMINDRDRTVSFMPWYHSYGLCELLSVMHRGACTFPHVYTTPIRHWASIQYVQPTILFTVPRLLELIHDKIVNSPRIYGSLSQDLLRSVWFGKEIRFVISGGAPLNQEVKLFYHNTMGLRILQGYGCTEMSPMISLETVFDGYGTHTGPLLPGIWLEDRVDGKICVNGPNRFMGYLGEPLQSKLDYYDTGDVGLHLHGKLYIHARASNSIKLSNGKFINFMDIEHHLKKQKKVEHVCVLHHERYSNLVAVVFDPSIKGPKQRKTIQTILPPGNIPIILELLEVPHEWLEKKMISLKGEILKREVVHLLNRTNIFQN
jgi:long-subunit acyl-CoA synthetase (AMP-forming)